MGRKELALPEEIALSIGKSQDLQCPVRYRSVTYYPSIFMTVRCQIALQRRKPTRQAYHPEQRQQIDNCRRHVLKNASQYPL